MNVFEAVKQTVTTRQAAELYGIRVNRHGMAVCPFHNDRNPSMKIDKRFHCFACQADGDAIDFVSRLFGLPSKEAAMKLADDFGICYDSRQKPSVRPKIREPTPEQKYQQEENHACQDSAPKVRFLFYSSEKVSVLKPLPGLAAWPAGGSANTRYSPCPCGADCRSPHSQPTLP